MTLTELDGRLKGGLVVSCQPVDDGPLDHDEVVARIAEAALKGGAQALRIEGAARLAHVRRRLPQALLIGIVKRDLADSPVRITPERSDVLALADAGADVIAVDATDRARPASVQALLDAIRASGVLAMADCATLAEGREAARLGFDIVGTTLSGYTGGPVPADPDWALLEQLAAEHPRVMAEGRIHTPAQVREALARGAWAVTVGTAITRTELVTQWFAQAQSTQS
ncbi:N-acetylmannosamine-6-phosphate 2-epimerase [Roseateles asaccharophilus]|uniref:Putative N-acetylmannosamine-6-phosphate 2-epimerase n=1 Tax=Roseateles asaccharophilus TaxID=582607 RepID=A0ABU2ABH6_9BURK|nr:N-acetylmannosamine-6-phosphate 2-epimerase [Roseateles asaccharophilus]MDR7334524.1 putative N-acetylmannosamine-6-phosphate epimerase [Roseateles asaccharophilus]